MVGKELTEILTRLLIHKHESASFIGPVIGESTDADTPQEILITDPIISASLQ